jgi:hypothetical protein
MGDYTLYGAEVSYFTGKVRAYLAWRGVPVTEQVATQAVYRDIILPNVGWPVIPVVKAPDGTIVQDSAEIIDYVEHAEKLAPPAIPQTPLQRFVAELLHLYADEWLVIPAMHYRWSFNEDWAYAEFGALSAPEASQPEQYEIGKKNGQRFQGRPACAGRERGDHPGHRTLLRAFPCGFFAPSGGAPLCARWPALSCGLRALRAALCASLPATLRPAS